MSGADSEQRSWRSGLSFVLAITGAAVGLGNIWRFPYMAGEHGGSAFLLLYACFVLCLGLPIMAAEIMIGRAGGRAPLQSLRLLAAHGGGSTRWGGIALWGGATLLLVLSFYSVVAGWALDYTLQAFSGRLADRSPEAIGAAFDALLADPWRVTADHTLFMIMTLGVVVAGVRRGIARLNNWLVPLLYGLLVALVIMVAIMTDGVMPALRWLLTPDFSRLDGGVVLNAMGHAFFTLATGACALMAYGAGMPARQRILPLVFTVAVLDVLVALLAGVAIFAVVFDQGMEVAQGPGLVFVTLPIAFAQWPGGALWLGAFMGVLVVATWTSSINMAEPLVAMLEDAGWSRRRAAWLIGGTAWALGLLSALSFSVLAGVRPLEGMSLFDVMTALPTDIMMPIGGLLIALFAAWRLDRDQAFHALAAGPSGFAVWRGMTRFSAIPLLAVVLVAGLLSGG
ncbi:NSS family neurotransmitter:Na+ symporter [Kushneria sinocarnis]|uniref:NSS family neurotransmitter:Na+ symporter n=1 Tax=Kushneria sinocarnis TaxID=595502 RepID=A0A420WVV8_9GAMM|nr:sodium-dependent transporter [Kushneria sinocarnis]RKR03245.1 NSS family neurotransmitter:Na+ symporter [Kushneria sinocarnis]